MSAPVARAAADLRLLRAAVFAAVCVVLSAAGHLVGMMGSGPGLPLWALGAAGALVFAVAAPLAGRERALPGIAAALAAGQLVLHALFTVAQRQGAGAMSMAAPAPPAGGADTLSDHGAVLAARHLMCGMGGRPLTGDQARHLLHTASLGPGGLHALLGGATSGAPAAHTLLPSLPMVLGHLLAAVAVGWCLRRGEAALWRLVRLSATATRALAARAPLGAVRRALVLLRALLAGARTGPPARAAGRWAHPRTALAEGALEHSVVRRGPPLALAA